MSWWLDKLEAFKNEHHITTTGIVEFFTGTNVQTELSKHGYTGKGVDDIEDAARHAAAAAVVTVERRNELNLNDASLLGGMLGMEKAIQAANASTAAGQTVAIGNVYEAMFSETPEAALMDKYNNEVGAKIGASLGPNALAADAVQAVAEAASRGQLAGSLQNVDAVTGTVRNDHQIAMEKALANAPADIHLDTLDMNFSLQNIHTQQVPSLDMNTTPVSSLDADMDGISATPGAANPYADRELDYAAAQAPGADIAGVDANDNISGSEGDEVAEGSSGNDGMGGGYGDESSGDSGDDGSDHASNDGGGYGGGPGPSGGGPGGAGYGDEDRDANLSASGGNYGSNGPDTSTSESSSSSSSSSESSSGSSSGNSGNSGGVGGGAGSASEGSGSYAPVVLDLDGDGVELVDASAGARYDTNDDGVRERLGWAGKDDGLLAIDLDGDGKITGAKELSFAMHTDDAGDTDLQGLAKVFDSNKDGVLDRNDTAFDKFRIWQDKDGDGISDKGEVKTLAEMGIKSIGVVSDGKAYTQAGNTVHGTASYTKMDYARAA